MSEMHALPVVLNCIKRWDIMDDVAPLLKWNNSFQEQTPVRPTTSVRYWGHLQSTDQTLCSLEESDTAVTYAFRRRGVVRDVPSTG